MLLPACGSRGKSSATGTFAPSLTVHTGRGTSVAELMPTAWPVLLGLAGRRGRAARRALRLARVSTPRNDSADHRPAFPELMP
jgi:hypothetical protein